MMCLNRVAAKSEKNKMSAANLSVIFGPNLMRAPLERKEENVIEITEYVNDITLSLITHYEELFKDVLYYPYYLRYVTVVQEYRASHPDELSLSVGNAILVTYMPEDAEWWTGEFKGGTGRFPKACCTFPDGSRC